MLSLLLVALLTAPSPDVLMPGFKQVPHEIVFERAEDLGGLRLAVSECVGTRKPLEVRPGQPYRFSGKYQTRIFVVAKDEVLPELGEEEWRGAHVSCVPPVSDQSVQPITSPVSHVLTRLRVASAGPDGLVLEELGTDKRWEPKIALALGTPIILGLGLLLWLRRRRRAAAVAT